MTHVFGCDGNYSRLTVRDGGGVRRQCARHGGAGGGSAYSMQHARAVDGGGSTRSRVLCAADEAFERSADCGFSDSCRRNLAYY